MTLHVLHVVESRGVHAGSAFISLSGLAAHLTAHEIAAEVVGGNQGSLDANVQADALRQSIKRADVVHIHGWEYPAARLAAGLVAEQGKRFVVSPLGAFSERPDAPRGWMERWRSRRRDRTLLRGCRRMLAIHRCEAEDCRRSWPDLATDVLEYGLDTEAYAAVRQSGGAQEAKSPRWMLILAPFHPAEGSVAFLKSLAELGRTADDWSVILAGPDVGSHRTTLQAALRRKGAADRARFEAADDEDAQRQLLTRADLIVSPALRVRCPVSVVQGLAAGVPGLASHAVAPDGAPEGLRTCAPTRSGFREAVTALLAGSEAQRRQSGDQARAWAKERIDWQVLAPRYASLYRDAARG